jgi:type IV pilus assembly protein PilW
MTLRYSFNKGFTLVELMIAMVLGLLLIAGVTGVFISTQQSYRLNDNLNRMQETLRSTFTLLSRDIRNAGYAGCSNTGRVVNVLTNNAAWWANWQSNRLIAFDGSNNSFGGAVFGTGVRQRVSGTSAMQMMFSSSDGQDAIVIAHQPSGGNASFRVNSAGSVVENDIVVVCDQGQSAIFQVSNLNTGGGQVNLIHNTGSNTPGNCTNRLGFPPPTTCSASAGTPYFFTPNATISKFESVAWFIGNNGRPETGGRSLYRMVNNQGVLGVGQIEELAEGVQNISFEFLRAGATAYVATSAMSPADWDGVLSVRVTMTLVSRDTNITSETGRLTRDIVHVVALRNAL